MARRRRGGSGRRAMPGRWHWTGFFLEGNVTPADTNADAFILFDPQAETHEGAIVHRVIGEVSLSNPATAGGGNVGMGIGVFTTDDASAILDDLDLIEGGPHSHETIGDTSFMWRRFYALEAAITGQQTEIVRIPIDVKVKRKVSSQKELLAFIIQGGTASRWKFNFWARSLLRI